MERLCQSLRAHFYGRMDAGLFVLPRGEGRNAIPQKFRLIYVKVYPNVYSFGIFRSADFSQKAPTKSQIEKLKNTMEEGLTSRYVRSLYGGVVFSIVIFTTRI